MTIGLGHYLSVAAILFTLGIAGIFLNRKNVIIILMSIELILLAVNINLVAFSTHMGDIVGQVYALFVLTVAAGASMISYFVRNQKDIVKKVGIYKTVIADSEKRYDEVQSGWRDGKYQITDRNLMIDGLMKQFIAQIDEA